jgi:hypothetical protein
LADYPVVAVAVFVELAAGAAATITDGCPRAFCCPNLFIPRSQQLECVHRR